jgi:hypothetical protein
VHCNAWDGAEDLTLEAASARVRVGPLLSPMASVVFVRFLGREWNLNAFELLGMNRGAISLRRWDVSARGQGLELHAEFAASSDDFVGMHERNPSGEVTYRLNTKLAHARVSLRVAGGETVHATSMAGALEIGTHDRDHGIRMIL